MIFAKLFHDPGFSDLSGSMYDEWLTPLFIFPSEQILH